MSGIPYSSDPENGISNFSDDGDIMQKAYVHDKGSGDQSTSLDGEIETLNPMGTSLST